MRSEHPDLAQFSGPTQPLPDPIPFENPASYQPPPPKSDFGRDREKPPAFCAGTFSECCFLRATNERPLDPERTLVKLEGDDALCA